MKATKILAVSAILFSASGLIAEPVELAYDNGNGSRYYQGGEGNGEAVCFSPVQPCSLLSFRFQPRGTGEMEWHIWGDNGAHEPDVENDLIDPFIVNVEDDDTWVTVDLSEHNLVFDPPIDFHIGYMKLSAVPQLMLSNERTFEARTHVYGRNQSLGWIWMVFFEDANTNGGNYLVRATVEYFAELNEYTFTEVTAEAGIGGIGNLAWGDYDNDGWEDLLISGRTLYRNLSDGTFENVSEEAGIVQDNPAGTGTWGDFDNDGYLDFFAGNSNRDLEDRLYRNNGDGTFEFVNDRYWFNYGQNPTAGCGWGDANGDGLLEIYIANSEYWNDNNPEYFSDFIFAYDNRDEIFFEITPQPLRRLRYYGRGVAWCDFDMDGDMDVYISNYRLQPNYLWVNQGDFEFEDQSANRGVKGYNQQGAYGHTIGSSWADFDNDGDFDLLVGNFAHPWGLAYQDKIMLCVNSGAPNYRFEDIRATSGIKYCETVFCPAWGDYDNDGWQDLFISAVYVGRQPFMYRNSGDNTFENVNYETGFRVNCYNSNSSAWCDYDHDGDLDIAIGNGGLFRNNGNEGHWLQVQLRGVEANKFAFGSQAKVVSGDLQWLRQVEGGMGSQGAQNMMTMHFGLGEVDEIDELIVTWIGGGEETYMDIEVDQRYTIVQGEGLYVPEAGTDIERLPSLFALNDPFPNPFNSQLSISFDQAGAGNVLIELFDLSGRKVETLLDKHLSEGKHRFTLQEDNLPAGNYLLQVTHRFGVVTRNVALLK